MTTPRNGNKPKRDNFTMIPNLVGMMELSPYAFRLYFHLKMVTGEGSQEEELEDPSPRVCQVPVSTLAKVCHMSRPEVLVAKQELIAAGLISVQPHQNGSRSPQETQVIPIWHKNHAMFHQVPFIAPHAPSGQPGERTEAPSGQPGERIEAPSGQPGERIEAPPVNQVNGADTPLKKRRKKEREEEPSERARAANSLGKFAKGFQALRDIPKYLPEPKRDASLVQFLEENEITGDQFFRAAVELGGAWPPRTSKNPDPWLSVRKYALNRKLWDAERVSATGPPGNGRYNRPRQRSIHERMMEVERATPPLRQPIHP